MVLATWRQNINPSNVGVYLGFGYIMYASSRIAYVDGIRYTKIYIKFYSLVIGLHGILGRLIH